MRDDRCRPSPRRHDSRRLATVLAATLAFGGCYTHANVQPTAVPSGPRASVVRLYLAHPTSVTGSVTPRSASEPQEVTVPAATGLAGRVVWASGDSLDIVVRAAMAGAQWQRFDIPPIMRIARRDVVRAEAPKIAPARTAATAVVVVGVVLLVAAVFALAAGMSDENY